MRVFVAFEIEKDNLKPILEKLNEYKEAIIDFRWTFNENLHITLCFFRDLDDIGINILKNAINDSIQNIEPIGFNTDHIITLPTGFWRNKDYGYVSTITPYKGIALNINKGKKEIKTLYENIENNLIKYGKEENYMLRPKEKREFIPHITLGRKKWKESVFHKFNFSEYYIIEGLLNKLIIYQSELDEKNKNRMHKLFPKYTKLYEYQI